MTKDLSKTFNNIQTADYTAVEKTSYYMPAPSSFDDDIFEDELDEMLLDEEYAGVGVHPEDIESGQTFTAPASREDKLLLSVQGLTKQYKQGHNTLNILNNVDLKLYSGEICALVGPSGSGKSSLLHILGLLDSPTSGHIIMGNQDIGQLSDKDRTKLRNGHIGFVYQFHHLLPEFSAVENVSMPQIIAGKRQDHARRNAEKLLDQLGLSHRLDHRPATLSGGEQQRVAIARALVNDPYLLFADEPTGNLDPETSDEVFQLLLRQVRERGIGALIATHNMDLAREMDRIFEVKSGRLVPY